MKSINTWPGWENVRKIGEGSFGSVYEIQRDVFGKIEKAALKVITIPQNENEIEYLLADGYDVSNIAETYQSYLKSIVQEYSLMADMKGNSNIVNCDDLMYQQHENGLGWDILIKMELLTPLTKSLGKYITEEQIIILGIDICNALVLCKNKNIVHRDIKPQNIFLSKYGQYKLGDFGIAKVAEKTASGTKTGTFNYMAPEVYNNQPYGSAADIYSLGMVLYWMLNERRTPFLPLPPQAATVTNVEEARRRRFGGEPIPEPVHGSERLKEIVLKACAFEPADRYSDAAQMRADLKALLERQGVDVAVQERAPEEETVEVKESEKPAEDAVVIENGAEEKQSEQPEPEKLESVKVEEELIEEPKKEVEIEEPEEKIEEVETTGESGKKRFWIWIGVAFAACFMFIWVDYSGMNFTIQYEEPRVLGDDLLSGNIEIEGDLYHLPAPVSAFTDNGWIIDNTYGRGGVLPGASKSIRLEKGDKYLHVYIKNFGDYLMTTPENCAVCDVFVFDDDNVSVTLPGNITFDSDKTEVEELLIYEYGFDRSVHDDICSYHYQDFDDREIYVVVKLGRGSEKVDYLWVESYAESYD